MPTPDTTSTAPPEPLRPLRQRRDHTLLMLVALSVAGAVVVVTFLVLWLVIGRVPAGVQALPAAVLVADTVGAVYLARRRGP